MRSRIVPLVVLGLVGVALLAIIVSISVGEKGPAPPVEGEGTVQRLYGGIEQDGASLGDPEAPITISIFNDLQCTDCASYQLDVVPELVEDLVRPGRARLGLRHLSIGQKRTGEGAIGATAAGEQEAQWQYAHLFYLNQDQVRSSGVTDEFLKRVAGAVPGPEFDVDQWEGDLDSSEVEARVQADAELATDLRLPVFSNPAVIVDGPGGTRRLPEAPSVAEIEAAADEVG